MSQFDEALAVCPVLAVGNGLGVVVSHEVEIKVGIGVLELVDHLHAEKLVKLDGSLRLYMESCQAKLGYGMGIRAVPMVELLADGCLRP